MDLRATVALGLTPALLVIPTGVVAWVLVHHPGDRPYETGIVFLALAGVSLVLLALEQVMPAVAAWREGWRQLPVDLAHSVISATAGTAAARIALFGLVAALAGPGGGGLGLWPTHWPLLAQLPLAVVISDLGMYTLHRASHASPLLWRFHAVHHSSDLLYAGATGRVHPLYVALSVLCATGPILLLGAPPPLFALLSTFVGAAGLLQHSNLALDFRPYRWLLATADAHRWHHAAIAPDGTVNFGNTLSCWDRMFSTWRLPDGVPDRIGLDDPQYPRGWWGQLARPFLRKVRY